MPKPALIWALENFKAEHEVRLFSHISTGQSINFRILAFPVKNFLILQIREKGKFQTSHR